MKKDFISITDLTQKELKNVLELGLMLKKSKKSNSLKGKTFMMLFEKPSLRTRLSFEVGIKQLGGDTIYIQGSEIGIGVRESIEDIARVVSRMCDGIIARVNSHDTLLELAKYSSIPVVNALSDREHPCQILADLLTIIEHKKDLKNLTIGYIGDGNNILSSLVLACSLLKIRLKVATPAKYALPKDILVRANGSLAVYQNPKDALFNADIVMTDTWVSMGDEKERDKRLKAFGPFQVNSQLMGFAKKDAIFMHCMPAHRGEEVTTEVIDGPQSVIFDEAENRLHAQKALLVLLSQR